MVEKDKNISQWNDYTDHDNKKLERGFYEILSMGHGLVYFTGEYSENGLPVFEKENAIGDKNNFKKEFDPFVTKRLLRLDKKDIKKILEELKQKTNWLEEKLKE